MAVGGTSLTVGQSSSTGTYYWYSETSWGNGTSSNSAGGGGGGGISAYESQPTYQATIVSSTGNPVVSSTLSEDKGAYSSPYRTYPDVSAVAYGTSSSPGAVTVVDSWSSTGNSYWYAYGTSVATPIWAGMVAVADQGRAISGSGSLTSAQTLTDLYSIAAGSAYSTDFNDITTGNSIGTDSHGLTYSPGTGYDLATGLGSPNTQALMPTLVGSSTLAFGQQPGTTLAGATISPAITVDVENSTGSIDTTNSGYVTLAIGTNPSGGKLLGTATVQAVNGVATFSGLWIDAAGTGYTLVATLGSLTSATSNAFNITANAAQPVTRYAGQRRFQPGDHREHVAFGPGQRSQQPVA